ATLLAAQGHQPTHRPALAWALQNALAAAPVPRGVIVIDDAHRIADPAAFAFLDALLERLPSHWSLLLASRQAPPLALARLRALGELAELQPAELQFSPAETQALARIRAPGWPDAAVQHLHERTQGWPAGISLALAQAPSARAHEPAGPLPVPGRIPECGARSYTSDRAVFDYLYSEVLAGLPAALRDFLLRCAALSEWSTDACADVSGRHDAAEWLDDIERRGLFVTAAGPDASGAPVLRPHAVFLDGLRAAAQRECAADWPALQQRASHWERARPAAAAVSVPAPAQAPAPAPIFPPASPAPAAPPAPASAVCMLSAREREVLARIASGDSNKLIARAFDLSPHTVKRHVANILDKLVLSSRVQAAAWHQAQKAHHHQPARQREMA
ncbi:MAG TPA: LuxR C-terminal-related transcriptional regulator, partial [Ideonella sp.]|nr:LuxR C-terminal-related transcriptional regulator [Ideonella sp.]